MLDECLQNYLENIFIFFFRRHNSFAAIVSLQMLMEHVEKANIHSRNVSCNLTQF